jgi:O-antigen/teichoic acid export membrane protein
MIVIVAGALSLVIVPSVAREHGERQSRTVFKVTRASAALAAAMAVGLAIVGPMAIKLVYGAPFSAAAGPMWILLPGTVAYAGSTTLIQGLYAANRPVSATLAQATGLLVTVPGLLLFLPRGGGILAAAAVSSVAYGCIAGAALVLYCRAMGIGLRGAWRATLLTR